MSIRLILIGLCFAWPLHAQESDLSSANARVVELEAKVRVLEARVKMLEAELAAAREELAAKEEAAADDEGLTDPLTVSDEAEEERIKTYKGVGDILIGLPGELRPPARGGWDKFSLPKAVEWIEQQPVGHRLARRTRITSITTQRNMSVGPAPGREWIVTVRLEPDTTHYMGMTIRDVVTAVKYYGDADFAKAAESTRTNVIVTVTGTIDGLKLAGFGGEYLSKTATFSLSDVTVQHDLFRNRQASD